MIITGIVVNIGFRGAYHYVFVFAAVGFHGVGFLSLEPVPVRKCFFIKLAPLVGRNYVKMPLPRILPGCDNLK
jgi:hypothetical protein